MSRITSQLVVGASVSFILFLVVGTAAAQTTYEYNDSPNFIQPTSPWPVEMGFSQDHSSTVQEGIRRGQAALIQAWGNYEVSTSQAEVLREQNRALRRDNDLRQTEALYTQIKMWSDHRIEERKTHEERAAAGQEKLQARRAVLHTAKYQLSDDQLDMITGEIYWPKALQGAEYQVERRQMEELFRLHVGYDKSQANVAGKIARAADNWKLKLRSEIATMSRDEYIATQKFLVGLKYSASATAQS